MSAEITAVGDIIVPSLFTKYSLERTASAMALIKAGVVVRSAEFDQLATDTAKTANMPFFQALSGRAQATPGDGTTELETRKITSSQDICAVHYRSNAWSANDLAGALAKADPMRAITDQVGDFWAGDYQGLLIDTLAGVFSAASMAAKIKDVHVDTIAADTPAVEIDEDVFIDALDLMGDASNTVTAMAVHSKVRNGLWKKDLIDVQRDSQAGGEIDYFLGRRLVVDDDLPKAAVTGGYKYTSYLFGEGAFAYGEGNPQNPVETQREIKKRNSVLVNDKILIMHPRGVKWAGTVSGNTPSDAELKLGTNWVRVYDSKHVRLVSVVSNG